MQIITRAQWGARRAEAETRLSVPVPRFHVHHTVTGAGDGSLDSEAAIVRAIQKYHMDSRGWRDIGYSFLISQTGRVFVGREWNVGAHSANDQSPRENQYSLGVAFIGNTQKLAPSQAAIQAYVDLIRLARRHGKLRNDCKIDGHRDVPGAATACPGNLLYAKLDTIRKGANAPAPAPTPAPVPTKPTAILSKAIEAAQKDPKRSQSGTTPRAVDTVKLIESALVKERLLNVAYSKDGSFGSLTVKAYAGWQRRLGYSGADADGIPGRTSLTKLGNKYGFLVK